MKVKALVSFAGVVSMIPGETREISPEIAKSLIKAKYVEEVIESQAEADKPEEKSKRAPKKKVT